jgi:LysR family transcriptional regulator for bpeEF and oprC
MDIGAIAAFVSASEGGSFTAAAAELGITASGVSKAVSRLESELRIRLFNRSTRSLSLTPDGTALYQRFRQVLNDLDDAKLAMMQAQTAPSGRLRVSMPAVFGRLRVMPAISAFMRRYPLVSIEASVTDRFVEVVEEAFDVVIRIGDLPDTSMIARRLGAVHFVVSASPVYWNQHGRPKHPRDLEKHRCVSFVSPQTRQLMEWGFLDNGRSYTHTPSGDLVLDNGEAVVDAAVLHAGPIYCHNYMIEQHETGGRLEAVLSDFGAAPQPVVVMYPQNRHLSARVRVFVDFMVEYFGRTTDTPNPAAATP